MQNIFPILSHDGSLLIKIGDFGSAKIASTDDPLITTIGTWEYQAPEILNGDQYTLAVDIWSLGSLFFRLLTGRSLFPNRKTFFTYAYSSDGHEKHGPRNALLAQGIESEAVIDLVTRMLQIRPENRPSVEDALSHEWFNNPSGVETPVTPKLYRHFMRVFNGPALQRLNEVHSETISFIHYHGNLCVCLLSW